MTPTINDFCRKEDGLYCKEKFLAAFIPRLEMIKTKIDVTSGLECRKYLISVTVPGDGEDSKLTAHEFDTVENIPYFQVWKECCDAGMSPKQIKQLNLYLQCQARTANVEKTYYFSRAGYYSDVFVFGYKQIINLKSEQNDLYETDKGLPIFKMPDDNNRNYMDYICRLLKIKKGVSEILLLCSLLSIMKPLFCEAGYPVNFFPTIYGRSGSGKSLLARLFFVLNADQEKNFKLDNTDSIGRTLKKFTGHAVVIDDYHPEALQYGKRRQDSILDYIARKADDRDSAMAVITAEFQGGCFSIQDRMIQIELKEKIADFDNLKYLQRHHDVYCAFLYDFADKVYKNRSTVILRTGKYFANNKCDGEFRISHNIRLLRMCAKIFYEVYLSSSEQQMLNNALDIRDFEEYISDILRATERQQIRYMTRLQQNDSEVDWLEVLFRILFDEKILYVCPDFDCISNPDYKGLACVNEKNRIYISSQTLKKALNVYFGTKITTKSMIDALVAEHILDEDKSASHMKKKKDGRYYYAIDENALRYYCQFL